MLSFFRLCLFLISFTLTLANTTAHSQNPNNRQLVLQGFWWDYWNSNYPNGWANYLTKLAPRLKQLGIDAIWIPPTIKNTSSSSVGYAPFDNYDLGDKFQKGGVKTRMGDKDEVLRMTAVLKANGIEVIQDLVLNHLTGAGASNGAGGADPAAMDDGSTAKYKNFRYACTETPLLSNSSSAYLSLKGRFSKNWQNFYPNPGNACCTNEINSPYWGPDISYEDNAYGFSSNAVHNPNQGPSYMRENTRNWLIWYKKQMGWDGVRLDAIKHFSPVVAEDFLWNLQFNALWANGGTDMFAVGEWVGGAAELDAWANAVQNRAGTFDFALRNALTGIVYGNGNFNLGTLPNYQQSNRQRTVPFVNNHDTFRPILDNQGNYSGFNLGSQLGQQIEPADPRFSVAYAAALAVDGAPEIFFEDLFNIGYNSNRFNHQPNDSLELPVFSDIENLIWCHQNLGFKQGAYLVRWQATDALIIERNLKAIVGLNDNWDTWQHLTGVQTSFPDGTVLWDYSGANTNTSTVYGGGKANLSIPPCNGSAPQGRKGYAVWAPIGIATNYLNEPIRTTQEWEMANDLGDSHSQSLQQGGALPSNSLECKVVGKVFAKANDTLKIEVYPESSTLGLEVFVLDSACQSIDSLSGTGPIFFNIQSNYDGWYSIHLRNQTAQQPGQKAWVKVNYMAPQVVNTKAMKLKCACSEPPVSSLDNDNSSLRIYPNPNAGLALLQLGTPLLETSDFSILTATGVQMLSGKIPGGSTEVRFDTGSLPSGMYFLQIHSSKGLFTSRFVRE